MGLRDWLIVIGLLVVATGLAVVAIAAGLTKPVRRPVPIPEYEVWRRMEETRCPWGRRARR